MSRLSVGGRWIAQERGAFEPAERKDAAREAMAQILDVECIGTDTLLSSLSKQSISQIRSLGFQIENQGD